MNHERSPIQHHLVLHRIDSEQGIRRFYSLMIERNLFGTVRLVRNWGRIGTKGQELLEIHADESRPGRRWRRLPGQTASGLLRSVRIQGGTIDGRGHHREFGPEGASARSVPDYTLR